MKHWELDHPEVQRVLEWVGPSTLQPSGWRSLESYADWLADEAVTGGGLGPGEVHRIWMRHLADSLAFACGWKDTSPPPRLLDVGAGVGLPGIPLAILWPETGVTLLDRAGRRVDLARRAVRLLGLENVEVRQGEVLREVQKWEGAVVRAVFPWRRALEIAESVLEPSGTAVIGLRGPSARGLPGDVGGRPFRVVNVPSTVLDGKAALLIMDPCER